jgi:uncharacterized membrane protein YsdA (DUF1294 family)
LPLRRRTRIIARMLPTCWLLVLVANVVTAGIFAFDKWRARARGQRRRVAERTLLAWTFATGWLGAWLAMAMLRHKTAKPSFRRWALAWTVVNPFWLLVWWTLRVQPAA